MRFIIIGLWIFVSTNVLARPLSFTEKVRDFEQLISMMKASYGPVEYKRDALNINIDRLRIRYLLKIRVTQTNKQFYYLLNRFIAEFKDSHFAGRLPTDHWAILPFQVDLVDGRVIVDRISGEGIDLERGDEIVEFGGQPVVEVIEEISRYRGMGFSGSSKRFATMMLTMRNGSIVPVPSGRVALTVLKRSGTRTVLELSWITGGTELPEDLELPVAELIQKNPAAGQGFELSLRPVVDELLFNRSEVSYFCNGSTRIKVPDNATMIMTAPFVAYHHPHPQQPDFEVGYLRIPHYSPDTEGLGEEDPFETRFQQYEYAISQLEQSTDALVIDQDHNCGGSVFYLERLVGLFMSTPFEQMQFSLLASKQFYLDTKEWLSEINQNTLLYHDFKQVVDLIHDTWRSGDAFLTTPIGFRGRRQLQPHHIRYTKPILMLIDELSGSGGDAFPALLGGYGRAHLFGTRTMGAGGHVNDAGPLYFSAHRQSMTRSLFYRPDGVPVENNGAVPDTDYTITAEDFLNQYQEYQAAYLTKVLELARGSGSDLN